MPQRSLTPALDFGTRRRTYDMTASPIRDFAVVTSPNRADRLVEAYWERAYRFAAMVTRSDQESADIAQDALLKVLRQLDRFDPEQGTFESWLWRIVLNVARDAGRAAGRRQALLDRLGAFPPEQVGGEGKELFYREVAKSAKKCI